MKTSPLIERNGGNNYDKKTKIFFKTETDWIGNDHIWDYSVTIDGGRKYLYGSSADGIMFTVHKRDVMD